MPELNLKFALPTTICSCLITFISFFNHFNIYFIHPKCYYTDTLCEFFCTSGVCCTINISVRSHCTESPLTFINRCSFSSPPYCMQLLRRGVGLTTGSDSELITQLLALSPPDGDDSDSDWLARYSIDTLTCVHVCTCSLICMLVYVQLSAHI